MAADCRLYTLTAAGESSRTLGQAPARHPDAIDCRIQLAAASVLEGEGVEGGGEGAGHQQLN